MKKCYTIIRGFSVKHPGLYSNLNCISDIDGCIDETKLYLGDSALRIARK